MSFVLIQDKITIVQQEIQQLYRLLQEAHVRRHGIWKNEGRHDWWDWVLELVGY